MKLSFKKYTGFIIGLQNYFNAKIFLSWSHMMYDLVNNKYG